MTNDIFWTTGPNRSTRKDETLRLTYQALTDLGPLTVSQLKRAVGNDRSFDEVVDAVFGLEKLNAAKADRDQTPTQWSATS